MGTLQDYARNFGIGRVVVTTIGIGSCLGLIAVLAIWASTYRSLFYLCIPFNENLCISVISWRGYCSAHLFTFDVQGEAAQAPKKISARMHDASRLDTADFEQNHRRTLINLDFFGGSDVLARIALPLWALAMTFAFTLAASIGLSFRFTVRALLISLTISSLMLGTLAMLLRQA